MTEMMHRLEGFKGEPVEDCIDKISQVAFGYEINVMDPTVNIGPIDNENRRLNVKTNSSGIITGFTIG